MSLSDKNISPGGTFILASFAAWNTDAGSLLPSLRRAPTPAARLRDGQRRRGDAGQGAKEGGRALTQTFPGGGAGGGAGRLPRGHPVRTSGSRWDRCRRAPGGPQQGTEGRAPGQALPPPPRNERTLLPALVSSWRPPLSSSSSPPQPGDSRRPMSQSDPGPSRVGGDTSPAGSEQYH